MSILSTIGLAGYEGCHFSATGYQNIANLTAPLVARDYYGVVPSAAVTAPDLQRAWFTTSARNQIALEFDQNMSWNSFSTVNFYLDRVGGKVTSGSVSGKIVKLQLNAASTNQTIDYVVDQYWNGSSSNLLYGTNGISALTFYAVPIAPPLPQIAVEQPLGSGLTDGVSPVDFSLQLVGQATSKVFTIRNPGTGTLTGLAATIDGAAAGDFIVTAPPAVTTLAPGASTTFTVTFTPSGSGTRNAGLHIASNDPARNPFDLVLTGQGNRAPLFAGYALNGTAGQPLSIYPAKILARASDPEGDAVTLTRVFGPSAQGGTVTLAGTVNYTPSNGFTGIDTFEVELTDAHGASARGTITITVTDAAPGPALNQTNFTIIDGKAEMVFRGIPGRSYLIQRSSDLSNWSDLGTVTAGPDGKIQYTDPAPPVPQGFYRTRSN